MMMTEMVMAMIMMIITVVVMADIQVRELCKKNQYLCKNWTFVASIPKVLFSHSVPFRQRLIPALVFLTRHHTVLAAGSVVK